MTSRSASTWPRSCANAPEPAARWRVGSVARAEHAHSVHVELAGLAPGRPYWYRFAAAGYQSRIGRTTWRTDFRAVDSSPDQGQVRSADAALRTAGSFVVERGRSGAQRA